MSDIPNPKTRFGFCLGTRKGARTGLNVESEGVNEERSAEANEDQLCVESGILVLAQFFVMPSLLAAFIVFVC